MDRQLDGHDIEVVDLSTPSRASGIPEAFEKMARPLLEVVHRATGLETAFVTHIDWTDQHQEVVLALNTGPLTIAEGTNVDWSQSMCRLIFLQGGDVSIDVRGDFPHSAAAEDMELSTFIAIPIVSGDVPIGSVCGASRRVVELGDNAVAIVRLVAEAMTTQLELLVTARASDDRAARAEEAARDAALATAHQERVAERMSQLALTDDLTGLPNRRAFLGQWEEELIRSARQQYDVALLMLDVDSFKKVNDAAGHPAGDEVLCMVAESLGAVTRADDVAARIGGDEFALAAAYTDAEGAMALAARVRETFADLTARRNLPCTLSVGVSASDITPRWALQLAADKALYRSKDGGRDRAELWQSEITGADR